MANYPALAIAVIAITLLLSPAWMAIMHRIEDFAQKGYSSYREALAEAYHHEIEQAGDWLWWVKVRKRALRKARAKRKAARIASLAPAASAAESEPEQDKQAGERPIQPHGDAGKSAGDLGDLEGARRADAV